MVSFPRFFDQMSDDEPMRQVRTRATRRSLDLESLLAGARSTLEGMGRLRARGPGQGPALFTALDVGSTHVKAAVCRGEAGRLDLLGWGIEPFSAQPDDEGENDGSPLAATCESAICRAEDETVHAAGGMVVPDQVLIALPATVVRAGYFSTRYRRRLSREPLTQAELTRALNSSQRAAIHELKAAAGDEADAKKPGGMYLIGSESRVHVEIDGHISDDPLGLRGTYIEVEAVNLLATAGGVEALDRLADRLKYDPPELILPVGALLRVADGLLGRDGVGIDIGGRGTTLALWQDGMMRGLTRFPQGGRDLTALLGRATGMNEARAENLKIAYARRQFDQPKMSWLADVLRPALDRWAQGLTRSLWLLTQGRPLPSDLWVWGGGSRLPDIQDALRSVTHGGQVSFAGYPVARPLSRGDWRPPESETPAVDDSTGMNVRAVAEAHVAGMGQRTLFQRLIREATRYAAGAEGMEIWSPSGD